MPTILSRTASIDDDGRIILGRFTGPAYPLGVEIEDVLGPKRDVLVVVTSMVNILTTPKRTLPYAPDRGSVVPTLLFEPFTDVTLGLIRYFTYKDLTEQEPRVVVRSVVTERIGDLGVRVTPSVQLVGDAEGDIVSAPLTFRRET